MSSKKKKRSCPFSSSKPRPKKGKKAISCESAADLTSSDKGSFFKQDEWLQEIEEHERRPDTSEKLSVEMSASRSKIRLEEAEEEQEDVGSWAKLNGRTTVSGENLQEKLQQSVLCRFCHRDVELQENVSLFPTAAKICLFLVTCQTTLTRTITLYELSNYYCSRKLILSFMDQHFICLTPRCR